MMMSYLPGARFFLQVVLDALLSREDNKSKWASILLFGNAPTIRLLEAFDSKPWDERSRMTRRAFRERFQIPLKPHSSGVGYWSLWKGESRQDAKEVIDTTLTVEMVPYQGVRWRCDSSTVRAVGLCFDLSRPETMNSLLHEGFPEALHLGSLASVVLIGIDSLSSTSKIPAEEIQKFAGDLGISHVVLCSIDDKTSIEDACKTLAWVAVQKFRQRRI